eukprot:11418878-Alexandrium_andersonii.AAC.1
MPGRRASSLPATRHACTQTLGRGRSAATQTPGLDCAMPDGERVFRQSLLEEERSQPGRVFLPRASRRPA